jgi:hypothetical protein
VIVYLSFYYIVKKIVPEKKNILLNFRRSMDLLTGLASLTSFFLLFFFLSFNIGLIKN